MDLEKRIERLLAAGHPEADTYEPPVLDVSRPPAATSIPWPRIFIVPIAATVAALLVLASLTLGSLRPGEPRPSVALPASPSSSNRSPTTPPPTTPPPAIEVVVVEQPEAAVMSRVVSVGQCAAMATHDFLIGQGTQWDTQIDDAHIDHPDFDHGWLTLDALWLGDDLVEVVNAFGGTWGAIPTEPPARGLREMWIVTERNGRPMAQQLIPWETPKGRTVWHRWNSVTVIPCPSTSP